MSWSVGQIIRRALALLLLLVSAQVHAAGQAFPNQGAAYEACMDAWMRANQDTWECRKNAGGYAYYQCQIGSSCSNLHWWHWPEGQNCSQQPTHDDWALPPGGGNVVCHEGCEYSGALDPASPTGASYAPTGSVCLSDESNEPAYDSDGDGVLDKNDAFPNDPNESADSDGDGIGDNADFAPEDPNDGQDTPGEEDGDDEGDNVASGGGDCNAPPTCSGDGIQCAQLYQQWRTACSGAKVTGSPETCNAAYSCTGDSAQCAQIALLRKTACSVEGIGQGGNGTDMGPTNGKLDGIKGVLDGISNKLGDGGSLSDAPPVPFEDGAGQGMEEWSSGLGSGVCPSPITRTVTIAGHSQIIEFSFDPLCQFADLFYGLFVAIGAVIAAYIVAGLRSV